VGQRTAAVRVRRQALPRAPCSSQGENSARMVDDERRRRPAVAARNDGLIDDLESLQDAAALCRTTLKAREVKNNPQRLTCVRSYRRLFAAARRSSPVFFSMTDRSARSENRVTVSGWTCDLLPRLGRKLAA